MRTLIIGGGGLLGSYLVPSLEALGHEVAICDDWTGCLKYKVPKSTRKFGANAGKISSLTPVFKAFDPEVVVVSLAYTPPRDVLYDFFHDVHVVLNSANTISSVLSSRVKHVYFCSSSEVYGLPRSKKPLKESRKITRCASHHGTSKWAAEKMLAFRCEELGIPFAVLRVFDLFGPRPLFSARTGVVSFLIDTFMRGEQIGLDGAHAPRDFIHAEDAAQAIQGVISSQFEGVVNIGTGKGTTLAQISEVLHPIFPETAKPLLVSGAQKPLCTVADTTVLKSLLPEGWAPQHEVLDTIPALVNFHQAEQEFRSDYKAVIKAMRSA